MALIGILFGLLGLLTALAWWRMHTRDRDTLAQWEQEEQEFAGEPEAFRWEDHVEDPDAWKGDDDSEP